LERSQLQIVIELVADENCVTHVGQDRHFEHFLRWLAISKVNRPGVSGDLLV
jgi:hypothetical protein